MTSNGSTGGIGTQTFLHTNNISGLHTNSSVEIGVFQHFSHDLSTNYAGIIYGLLVVCKISA